MKNNRAVITRKMSAKEKRLRRIIAALNAMDARKGD